jgi:Tol biopolymer transport system component
VSRHDGGVANCDGTHHASNSSAPFIDSTGNIAVFHSLCAFTLATTEPADTAGYNDVFLRNISAETTTRVSLTSTDTEPDGDSWVLAISDDAQYVLFYSDATNLVTGDTNGARDLFIRDTVAGTTTRIGLDVNYGEIAGGVETARMSRNGDYVVFSTITNLLPSDANTDLIDVYLLQLR